MSDLFGGTLNFTPAFTGQELAIRAGGGMASAFTSGMNAGTAKKNQALRSEEFQYQKAREQSMMMKQAAELYGWGLDFSDWIHNH